MLLLRTDPRCIGVVISGDTAQSIMRGIAFRFSDLRSLFYHAKMSMHEMGKTSAVRVPKQVGLSELQISLISLSFMDNSEI